MWLVNNQIIDSTQKNGIKPTKKLYLYNQQHMWLGQHNISPTEIVDCSHNNMADVYPTMNRQGFPDSQSWWIFVGVWRSPFIVNVYITDRSTIL